MPEKTAAQKKAQKTYMGKFSRVEIRVSPDLRNKIQAHAEGRRESVNAFVTRAILETMRHDQEKPEA